MKPWLAVFFLGFLAGCGGGATEVALPSAPTNPVPTITSLFPLSAVAGGGNLTLTINGSGFGSNSMARWNGNDRSTTFVSNTQIQASISMNDIVVGGTANVTVFNPPPGGGVSVGVAFVVDPGPAGVLERSSVASDGTQANNQSSGPALSSDGRFAVFVSAASNLVPDDTNGRQDAFLRDTCVRPPAACTPSTQRVSVASDGTQANGDSFGPLLGARGPAVSEGGRFVAFASAASNLVSTDTNGITDVFVRNTCIGAPAGCTRSTVRISVASDGSEAHGFLGSQANFGLSISANGRLVAFGSDAGNLVAGDTNNTVDVFLRDTCVGAPAGCTTTTVRVSVTSDGNQADSSSLLPSLNADGRFVAFQSFATNLVAGDTNRNPDVFVRDTCSGAPVGCVPTTVRASVATNGSELGFFGSGEPSISLDGRFVGFSSQFASSQVFVRDTWLGAPPGCTPATVRVSVPLDASPPGFGDDSGFPSLGTGGRFVAFRSRARNLVPGDTNGFDDIFVRDTCLGAQPGCVPATIRVSVATDGSQANFISFQPALSSDGRLVAFHSAASNLITGDTNQVGDIFLARTGL